MRKSRMKQGVLFIIFMFLFSILSLFASRSFIIMKAEARAKALTSENITDTDSLIRTLTKTVHDLYLEQRSVRDYPLLIKLRPYITNHRLPAFIKVPEGAIETLYPVGWCDNTARMLAFLLHRKGFKTRQWNMITPISAHAALVVDFPDGRTVYLDPYHGVVAEDESGVLTGPYKAQKFTPLSAQSDVSFYKNFDQVMMAAQGERLDMHVDLPGAEMLPLTLGKIDGHSDDVKSAGAKNALTPHWSYLGSRYDRSWVRSFKAVSPVTLTLTLTKSLDPGIMTANKPPAIKGKTLSWALDENEELAFADGSARFSFFRMNSYIPVDQIVIEPR